jgi:molybdopterin-guanine dinucleotide biosynthesis protein A
MDALTTSGAVLAGGRSTRMGRDKASLLVHGEPLLLRQLRLLADAGCADRLVSSGASAPGPAFALVPDEVRIVADHSADAGPLAGLARVLTEARYDLVIVIAVDLPGLDAGFLRALIAEARPGVGVVPSRNGQHEPLVAVYPRVAAAAEALARLGRGEFALRPFVRAGIASGWMRERPVAADEDRFFTHWNRPEDLPPAQPC